MTFVFLSLFHYFHLQIISLIKYQKLYITDPYSGVPDPTCPIAMEKNGKAGLKNWTRISTNETEIAYQLATIGPLSAGINQIGMEHYRGGVVCPIADICDPNGKYLKPTLFRKM